MVFDSTEYSSSRSSSHQLLLSISSVLVMLASVQLIPVCLIKLPPVTSLFLGCTTQHETATLSPSLTAVSGKATINLGEKRVSPHIQWGTMQLWRYLSITLCFSDARSWELPDRQYTLSCRKSVWSLSGPWQFCMLQWEAQRPWWVIMTALVMLLHYVRQMDKDSAVSGNLVS